MCVACHCYVCPKCDVPQPKYWTPMTPTHYHQDCLLMLQGESVARIPTVELERVPEKPNNAFLLAVGRKVL